MDLGNMHIGWRIQGPGVGIDLGTTSSAIAYLNEYGRTEMIHNEDGQLATPSVVYFDEEETLVGDEAVRAAEHNPLRVARYAKHRMGSPFFRKRFAQRRLPPEVIQALILEKLKQGASRVLGTCNPAVITVPTWYNANQRQAIRNAGRIAGLEVIDLISEPMAATLAYASSTDLRTIRNPGRSFASDPSHLWPTESPVRLMIYGLGGGSFDATIVEINAGHFETLAAKSDRHLGGLDWTKRIMDYVADELKLRTGTDLRKHPSAVESLFQSAEIAKRSLSVRNITQIPFGDLACKRTVVLTRKTFEAITADLIERTRLTCEDLLRDADMDWRDLNRVLPVGGGTRMPAVQNMLAENSGPPPDRFHSPDESVARGAAVYAKWVLEGNASATGISIRNHSGNELSVLGTDSRDGDARRRIIFPRQMQLPAVCTKQFRTARENQSNILLQVVEGGDEAGQNAVPIGRCVISNLPPRTAKGTVVKVTFRYEQNETLTLEAEVPTPNYKAWATIKMCTGLGDDEIARWSEFLRQGFKLSSVPVSFAPGQADDSELDRLLEDIESGREFLTIPLGHPKKATTTGDRYASTTASELLGFSESDQERLPSPDSWQNRAFHSQFKFKTKRKSRHDLAHEQSSVFAIKNTIHTNRTGSARI